jgi:ribosome-binding factor A
VTGVSISKDLSYAKVGISILGNDKEKENIFRGLESARGFLRKELSTRIRLRRIPELSFQEDDSIAKGSRLLELIDNISS